MALPDEKFEISRIVVKPPPFWQDKPALWFTTLESQFFTAGIKGGETKYHYVVSVLSGEILEQITDVLSQPITEASYEKLDLYPVSGLQLGDQKPSMLLRHMKDLAGTQPMLWLQHLPATTQAILTVSSDDLDKLAEMPTEIQTVESIVPAAVEAKFEAVFRRLDDISERLEKLESNRLRSRSNS